MKSSLSHKHTLFIKEQSKILGFDYCGISKATRLDEEEFKLSNWLSKGFHGKMSYMENHFNKRLDPTELVPGARSVISLMYNYYPNVNDIHKGPYCVARYAFGKDYHNVIRKKLNELFATIQEGIGEISGRVFVDSAPVMERQWAAKSGLGWLGKNSLLISKVNGSYFFLAELIIDLELEYDNPIRDYCGTCTRCIDACPTDAILGDVVIDASRCISYLTIELKEAIPEEFRGKYTNWIFGCDICQEVCPWNRFAKGTQEPDFKPTASLHQLLSGKWLDITEEVFNTAFRESPLKRSKYQGIMKNIAFLSDKNSDQDSAV